MINHLKLTFVLLVSIIGINCVLCLPSYEDIQSVFDELTNPINYKSWIRPSIVSPDGIASPDNRGPLYVNVSIDLYNFATVDEITSEYTFHLFIDLEWFDPRLKFSMHNINRGPFSSKSGNEPIIEGGNYHIQRIWYPSVFIPNNQEPGSFDYDNQSANLLKIKPNGYVWLRKRKLLRVYCNMDFHLFPFDEQICYLHLESSISTTSVLRLRWNQMMSFSKSDSFHTIGFNLKSHEMTSGQQTYSKNNSFSRVSLKVTLVREWAHYMFMFYLPTAIIVIASWASFWLEITSPPARVSIGVTTMLALVTTFKTTKSQLPTVSYWNALDIWNMVCIVFIFSSLIEFAFVNYIFNTEKRRKRNKKLKRKRAQSVLKSNDLKVNQTPPPGLNNNNVKASSRPNLETIYSQTLSTFSHLSKNLSDLSGIKRKNIGGTTGNDGLNGGDINGQAFDQKPRLSVIGLDMKDTDHSRSNSPMRRASIRSRSQSSAQTMDTFVYKLTPQELANEIDYKSRRIFPICFIVFNIIYWIALTIKF